MFNTRMRWLVIAVAVTLILGWGSMAFADDLAIAVVNTQQIFEIHPAVQQAQQELQAEQHKIMEEMDDMDNEEEAAMMQQQMQQELQMLEQQLLQEALDDVRDDVGAIAAELGYDVVLDANALLAGGEDITETVMDEIGEAQ